jgi:hypothetical protein
MPYLRPVYNYAAYMYHVTTGKRPWSLGYVPYRERQVEKVLKKGEFDPDNPGHGYGLRLDERAVEYPWLFSRLPGGSGRLLDAGSALNHGFLLSRDVLSGKKVFISTLSPEPQAFWKRGISYVFEDLRETCFRDGYFDWVVSLSTVEHIGLDNTLLYTSDGSKREDLPDAYLTAIKEYHRVLRDGGTLYVTFPFGAYKHHRWFQVFNGAMIDRLVEVFSPSTVKEWVFKYERTGWKPSTREDAGNARCFDITVEKKRKRNYPAFSEAVACLELTK